MSLLPPRMGPGRTGVPQGKASKRTADAGSNLFEWLASKAPKGADAPAVTLGSMLGGYSDSGSAYD